MLVWPLQVQVGAQLLKIDTSAAPGSVAPPPPQPSATAAAAAASPPAPQQSAPSTASAATPVGGWMDVGGGRLDGRSD